MFRSRLPQLVTQKAHKERRKITQIMIANETGISANTISGWMQPKEEIRRLDAQTVMNLLTWLGCDLEDLIEVITDPDEIAAMLAEINES